MPQWHAPAGAEPRQPADALSAAVDHMLQNATWDRVSALADGNRAFSKETLQGVLSSSRDPVCLDESVLLAPTGDAEPNAAVRRCQALGSPCWDGEAAEQDAMDTMKGSLSMLQLDRLYQQVLESEGEDIQTTVRCVLQNAVAHISVPALQGLARAVEVAIGTLIPDPVKQAHRTAQCQDDALHSMDTALDL